MTDRDFVIEEVSDPDEIRRSRAQDERHRRNSAWLQAHWGMSCRRPAASLSPSQDKKRSSLRRRQRRGPGPRRHTGRIMAPSSAMSGRREGHASMLIAGEWQVGDDGVTRPIVRAQVFGADGRPVTDDFLIDSGADRTVLSTTLLARLQLPTRSAQPGLTLSGIGGESAFVVVTAVIEFLRDEGGPGTGPWRVCRVH